MIRVTWQPLDGSFHSCIYEEGCDVPLGYSNLIRSVWLSGNDLIEYWNDYSWRNWPMPRDIKHLDLSFELCGDWARMYLCNRDKPMPNSKEDIDEIVNNSLPINFSKVSILTNALSRIYKWFGEFPEAEDTRNPGNKISYAEAYGSNGERDYMRKIAQDALDEFARQ